MSFDFSSIVENWRFLADGVATTLLLCALAIALGLAVGSMIGIGRVYGGPIPNLVLSIYVDTMRAIPLLVVLVWVFFAMPIVTGISLPPLAAGVIGLGAQLAAFVSEVVRAGLTSIRSGQLRASLALGMSRYQAIRFVILPQAVIRMLPAFGSLLVITIKDSAIASVIAVPEIMHQSQVLVGNTYRPFETFTAVLIIYFLLCWPVARGVDRIYRHLAYLGSS